MNATTIAVDLAKNVFELALADAHGKLAARRRLSRRQFERFFHNRPPCRVVMEACGSAHHWGRYLTRLGFFVELLPAQYVRAYVRRNKTDRADAEALLEASRCAELKPVPVKSAEQQAICALHRIRAQWMASRTARINALRGLLREQGIIIAAGAHTVRARVPELIEDAQTPIPRPLRHGLWLLYQELAALEERIADLERELRDYARQQPVVAQLKSIPGIGLLTATALHAQVGDIRSFAKGRHFASWLGLTPREYSSGQHRYLGRISKRGDTYLRCLLVHGARAVLLAAQRAQRTRPTQLSRLQRSAIDLHARVGHNKAAVALANKLARIVWAVWSKQTVYLPQPESAAAN